MNKEKNKADNEEETRGCQGCLLVMVVALALFTIPFMVYHFNYSKNKKKYMQDPYPAHKEIVEGFAGIEFPPYKVKETIMETNKFLGDYIDTIKLEFNTIPDSSFYNEIEKACEQYIHLESQNTSYDFHFWLKDDNGNYYTYYLSGHNNLHDSIQSVFISRGVPADFIVGVDRIYQIHIKKGSPEWRVIVGRY